MDFWSTFPVGRGWQASWQVNVSSVLGLHNLFTWFLKDRDLIGLGNQNTRPPGVFPTILWCPSFKKASLRKRILWRVVWIICGPYIPLDQLYPRELSVVVEMPCICAVEQSPLATRRSRALANEKLSGRCYLLLATLNVNSHMGPVAIIAHNKVLDNKNGSATVYWVLRMHWVFQTLC